MDCACTAAEVVEKGMVVGANDRKEAITLRNGDVKTVGNVGQNEKAGDDEDDVQRENVVLFIVRWRVVGRRRISG